MAKIENKRAEMSALIKLWRETGSSKKLFCSSHGVNIHTFTYWLSKEGLENAAVEFIEVRGVEQSKYLELSFPQGAVMRLSGLESCAQLSVIKSLLY